METKETKIPEDDINVGVREYYRFKIKGWGIFPSLLMVFCIFYFIPPFVKARWESFLGLTDIRTLLFGINFVIGFFGFWLINLVFVLIYKANHPFFEQYRTTTRPWPWVENPEAWNKLLKKAIPLIIFNTLVVVPVISFLDILP